MQRNNFRLRLPNLLLLLNYTNLIYLNNFSNKNLTIKMDNFLETKVYLKLSVASPTIKSKNIFLNLVPSVITIGLTVSWMLKERKK